MATIVGRNATVEISPNGSSGWVAIGKITSASLSLSAEALDETNNDSAGYKENQYGSRAASLDIGFKYSSADAGQDDLLIAADDLSDQWFRFRPDVGAPELEYIFKGRVTDLTVDTETEAVEDGSATIESSGAITKQAQT